MQVTSISKISLTFIKQEAEQGLFPSVAVVLTMTEESGGTRLDQWPPASG